MSINISFKRSHYDTDNFEIVGSTNSFRGSTEVEQSSVPSKATKVVDGTVKITTVADDIRHRATKHWLNREVKADFGMAFSAVALAGAAVGAIAGGIVLGVVAAQAAVIVGASLLAVATAVGIVALFALGLSFAFQQHAKRNVKEWRDPVAEIAQHRREADVLGYPYLKAKCDLRQRSFAPGEKTTLALRTMDSYLARYNRIDGQTESTRVDFVDEFFAGNPLSGTNRDDAFSSNSGLAENLVAASRVYGRHERSYREVVREARSRRDEIDRAKNSQISTANMQKSLLLSRLNARRERALGRHLYHRQDSRRVGTRRGCEPLDRDTALAQRRINSTYALLETQIELHFTGVRRDITLNADRQTRLVNDWESARKQLFVQPIGQILGAFVEGRDLDQRACEIDSQEEAAPPAVSVTYIFPSFNLEDLEGYDADDLLELRSA